MPPLPELGLCEAVSPAITYLGVPLLWWDCARPAVAIYFCQCYGGPHRFTRASCAEHDPSQGPVGCWQCLMDGHSRPLTATLLERL